MLAQEMAEETHVAMLRAVVKCVHRNEHSAPLQALHCKD